MVFDADSGMIFVQFSEGVISIDEADLVIEPVHPAGSNVTPSSFDYGSISATAIFLFTPGLASGLYRAFIAAGAVTDDAGNPLATGAEHVFIHVAAGDFLALPAGTRKVNQLAIAPTGQLDLGTSSLVIDYDSTSPLGSWNGSAYTDITGSIQSGQLFTSMSDVGDFTTRTLGIGEAAAVLGIGNDETTVWNGVTVDGSSVIVKYTYTGDVDLNGEINGDDYFFLDSNVINSGIVFGYAAGDINLDGEINGDDYFWLDSQIVSQGPPL
jgi:hypothetical protein